MVPVRAGAPHHGNVAADFKGIRLNGPNPGSASYGQIVWRSAIFEAFNGIYTNGEHMKFQRQFRDLFQTHRPAGMQSNQNASPQNVRKREGGGPNGSLSSESLTSTGSINACK